MTRVFVTPKQFDTLKEVLQREASRGQDPESCTLTACKEAGIDPPRSFEPLEIVVLYDAAS